MIAITKYRFHPHVVKSWDQDEVLVYNRVNGNTHLIDHDAARVLQCIDKNKQGNDFDESQTGILDEKRNVNLKKVIDKKLQELLAIDLIYYI